MEMKRLEPRKELPDIEEFKKAVQPLIEWINVNCNPQERSNMKKIYGGIRSAEPDN